MFFLIFLRYTNINQINQQKWFSVHNKAEPCLRWIYPCLIKWYSFFFFIEFTERCLGIFNDFFCSFPIEINNSHQTISRASQFTFSADTQSVKFTVDNTGFSFDTGNFLTADICHLIRTFSVHKSNIKDIYGCVCASTQEFRDLLCVEIRAVLRYGEPINEFYYQFLRNIRQHIPAFSSGTCCPALKPISSGETLAYKICHRPEVIFLGFHIKPEIWCFNNTSKVAAHIKLIRGIAHFVIGRNIEVCRVVPYTDTKITRFLPQIPHQHHIFL